jgi:hypothetical protein
MIARYENTIKRALQIAGANENEPSPRLLRAEGRQASKEVLGGLNGALGQESWVRDRHRFCTCRITAAGFGGQSVRYLVGLASCPSIQTLRLSR